MKLLGARFKTKHKKVVLYLVVLLNHVVEQYNSLPKDKVNAKSGMRSRDKLMEEKSIGRY